MANEIKIEPVLIEYPVPEKENKLFSLLKGTGNKLKDVGVNSKNVLSDLLLGKEVKEPETVITADKIESGVNNGGRQGGLVSFVNDIASGTKENLNTPFNANNLLPSKKGFGYRLGEALGTGARLLDNSLVRGAIAYGLSKHYGDTNPLEQGLTAMVTNQQNKSADQLYRQSLAEQKIDTSNVRGYISPQSYNAMLQAKQLQDNAEWRKANLEAQQNQNKILNDLRQRELNLGYAKLKADKEGKANKNLTNLGAVSNQLARFEETFKTMPGKIESNTLGRLRNATGFQTPNEANFNSQRTLLFNKIARDLGGEKGVLSDQDIKRIEVSLPSYTDSYEQKQAKMQAIYDLLKDRLSVEGVILNNPTTQKDSLGIL